ncbi:MAG: hypothetical protein HKN47_03715 [Pirellulaceae bacterium]|nr:hypothetical protein [Pirellulaceae bacterium]
MAEQKHNRSAVTLIEVMFAMSVALIGLVGLISVLPIAGRRTQDAINLNDGAALAHSVFDELKARDLLKPSAWTVRFDNIAAPGSFHDIDPNGTVTNVLDFTDAWCIDPLFVSAPESQIDEASGGYFRLYDPATGNGYRRTLFPYYRAEQNPLVDPSLSEGNTPMGGPADTRWWTPTAFGTNNTSSASDGDFGARMIRVGLARRGVPLTMQAGRESESTVDDRDGVATTETKDRTLNVTLQGQKAVFGGSDFGKQLTDGSLSWIATVNRLPGTNFANVSVVILRNRDRGFVTYPAVDGGGATPVADEPGKNALDERLAYVTYATGFSGGAGGTIHLVGAANTPSNISTNDWIMLSRRTVAGNDFHRWYRIVSVTLEAQEGTFTDPVHGGTRAVWQHKLFLDGPDWSFGFPTPGNVDTTAAAVIDNTYATILTDVVAVSEHVILIE